ncbi:MAG: 5-formyltetrahydrofolate cyclo-ligase [Verrucomicrobia bacterium]|nr:5-formyltetrahydrofolate cyclo-ligase [Verrucomicrobiota bacterium]
MSHPRKAALREEIRQKMAGLDKSARVAASQKIQEAVLGHASWGAVQTIALYLSLPDEPETRGILQAAMAAGKRVVMPKIDLTEGLTWWMLKGSNLPQTSSLWEPSPEKSVRVPVEEIGGFLVPGRAFDPKGARLGRGGGHYDRALARRIRQSWVVGLFYSAQELAEIPQEPHDIPLPGVVTESGWRKFV